MPDLVYRFAEALWGLLAARTARAFEARWSALDIDALGWQAVRRARSRDVRSWESALDEVDGLLLRLLDRAPALAAAGDTSARDLRTFRLPALERMQHATAAALVSQRYGGAGLRAVVADQDAPLARRYYAFLALAERHRPAEWHLFTRYLIPGAHHAFVGTAAEAVRFYPQSSPGPRLVALFESVRRDLHLRAFLSPRILESLFVLRDRSTLPFFEDLLTSGHTTNNPERCEVTRALVMVRHFTGRLAPNTKYADSAAPQVQAALDEAEAVFEAHRDILEPVVVI